MCVRPNRDIYAIVYHLQRDNSMLTWEGSPVKGVNDIIEKLAVGCVHHFYKAGTHGTTGHAFPKGYTRYFDGRCAAIVAHYQ